MVTAPVIISPRPAESDSQASLPEPRSVAQGQWPDRSVKGALSSQGGRGCSPEYSLQHATAAGEDARRERRLEHIRGLSSTSCRRPTWSGTEPAGRGSRRQSASPARRVPRDGRRRRQARDVRRRRRTAGGPSGNGTRSGALGAIEDAVLMRPVSDARHRDRPGPAPRPRRAGVTWGEVQAAAAAHASRAWRQPHPRSGWWATHWAVGWAG